MGAVGWDPIAHKSLCTIVEMKRITVTHKTKVFKNDVTLDQIFNLGEFSVADTMNIYCKGKRTGETLGSSGISLDQFAAEGNYDYGALLGEICKVSLQLTIGGPGIKRSSSIQNLKGKLSR